MCTSFIFGGLEGKSLLIFAKQGARFFSECFAKIFGHRSKTVHRTVFSLRSIPLILWNEKITREHSKEHSLAIFGGLEGNRTPVRKPLDMTFSVGSQSLLFPTGRRQLTGNAQSVAPLCLIGSGATADASSPLRWRSVRSRGPLRRNGWPAGHSTANWSARGRVN